MKRPSGDKVTLIRESFSASGRSFGFEVAAEVVTSLFAGLLRDLKIERHERHFKEDGS